ncbi:AAA family ATPase [Plantactinospora soyae]|uniref:Kinase n=1 Tax=Plantactinospora soyae TaxID=1544732 RepID=A0A927ME71_9ACTN|nr:AAA family ATPase [Plantactinospora soyae]MBE1491481.1 putative kinase [Plantactinospora soyae]
MADHVILVNGLPGSGKTTLAAELAPALSVPLVAKDAIKEAIAAAVSGVSSTVIGRATSEMMWTLAEGVPGRVLLESWWFTPRDLSFAEAGLRRCGARTVVEIWCDVPAELARHRCALRRRHAIHEDERRLAESWPEWSRRAEPLGLGHTLRVRTDRPVDVLDLVRRIDATTPPPAQAGSAAVPP